MPLVAAFSNVKVQNKNQIETEKSQKRFSSLLCGSGKNTEYFFGVSLVLNIFGTTLDQEQFWRQTLRSEHFTITDILIF